MSFKSSLGSASGLMFGVIPEGLCAAGLSAHEQHVPSELGASQQHSLCWELDNIVIYALSWFAITMERGLTPACVRCDSSPFHL